MALNAWGGKQRPIPESMTNPEFFDDPSRRLARILGREFMFNIGAMWIHRIGLMQGLGWVLPYTGASQDINYVRITHSGGSSWKMKFGKVNRQSNYPTDTIEILKTIRGVHSSQIIEVYNRETTDV